MTEIVAVPAIFAMCYMVGLICKAFEVEKLNKFIPSICGVIGAGLGILVFLTIPNFIPAENWASAVAVGIVSGLSATGVNQIFKQFTDKGVG